MLYRGVHKTPHCQLFLKKEQESDKIQVSSSIIIGAYRVEIRRLSVCVQNLFPQRIMLCSSKYLQSGVSFSRLVSTRTAPSTVMCVTSVWTNGWKENILAEQIQDTMSAASVQRQLRNYLLRLNKSKEWEKYAPKDFALQPKELTLHSIGFH